MTRFKQFLLTIITIPTAIRKVVNHDTPENAVMAHGQTVIRAFIYRYSGRKSKCSRGQLPPMKRWFAVS